VIRDREPDASERRRQAHYIAALALFRSGAVADGVREADGYRVRYGEDPWSTELRYREGEARLAHEPDLARAAFSDVAKRAPLSLWGAEARKRLATLEATPAK
jgi:hypothetical protein